VAWIYPPEIYPEHWTVLSTTLVAAGFQHAFLFRAATPGRVSEAATNFIMLARDGPLEVDAARDPSLAVEDITSPYPASWHRLARDPGIRPNSVLAPNLDLLIPAHKGPRPHSSPEPGAR